MLCSCLTCSGFTEVSASFGSLVSISPGLRAHQYFPNYIQDMYPQIMKYLQSDRCTSATAFASIYPELRVKHMGLLQAHPFSLL